jgi:hypothetical protein
LFGDNRADDHASRFDPAMKVLNLRCGREHSFEGWFGSDADYESQLERKLIECPMCGDAQIVRMPTAPRLNVSNLRDSHSGRPTQREPRDEQADRRQDERSVDPSPAGRHPGSAPTQGASASSNAMTVRPSRDVVDPRSPEHAQALAQAQADVMQALREVVEKTEDVGDQFPEEARRMHYGEAEQRSIRGVASMDDAAALREEGIDVLALPLPPSLKGRLQ